MPKKLLIIEDNANILCALQAKFRIEGFEVLTENGSNPAEEIISLTNKEKPDYIVLDLILPKVDGFSLLADLKADAQLAKIPVFIFTNLSDEDSRQRGASFGAEQYLIKSELNIDDFVEKIKKIIKNRVTRNT